MENYENTVADELMLDTEQSADDAQTAEVTAEDILATLTSGGSNAETAVNSGDGDPAEEQQHEEPAQESKQDAKVSKQIRAALKSQRDTLIKRIGQGLSEAELVELVRNHQAAKLAEENKDISPAAARMIIDARNKDDGYNPAATDKLKAEIDSLYADGWTIEQLQAFANDESAQADVASGKTARQAATAYLMRQAAGKKPAKKSVPSLRSATGDGAMIPDRFARMSDKEFGKLSDNLYERLLAGEKISL